MAYLEVAAGEYHLGWRHAHRLPLEAKDEIEQFVGLDEYLESFSPERRVSLQAFAISIDCIHLSDLYQFAEPEFEALSSLMDLSTLVGSILRRWDQRLPTEDEWEAAFGPGLFPWGETIPDGIPYEKGTEFTGHLRPSRTGLNYNGSTYEVELVHNALKLGDGGSAVCGGDPWPMAWLSLALPFRLTTPDIEGAFHEYLESAEVRPVRLS